MAEAEVIKLGLSCQNDDQILDKLVAAFANTVVGKVECVNLFKFL